MYLAIISLGSAVILDAQRRLVEWSPKHLDIGVEEHVDIERDTSARIAGGGLVKEVVQNQR